MSNRKLTDTSLAAKHRAAYEQQIAILLDKKLSEPEKLEAYMLAAEFSTYRAYSTRHHFKEYNCNAAMAVWSAGEVELSLFAFLPGCECPVHERTYNYRASGGEWEYIPSKSTAIPFLTERQFRAFANIQMQKRFGE
jgi:hypothetical protein